MKGYLYAFSVVKLVNYRRINYTSRYKCLCFRMILLSQFGFLVFFYVFM